MKRTDLPRGSVQSQSTRAARDDRDLSIKGKDVGKVGQLNLFGSRHDYVWIERKEGV